MKIDVCPVSSPERRPSSVNEPPRERFEPAAPALPERIPSLDGLRAISILLVLLAHFSIGLMAHLGNFGVRMFFLISGFLITALLLKEYDRANCISLRNFYVRRILRIFPAFYAYMAVVFVLASFGLIRLLPGDMLHALTYTMNYHVVRSWYVNHIWSLSVEEQFYLLWPAVLVFAGIKKARRVAVVTILLVPVIRLIMYYPLHASATALDRNFQAVCDVLATGCLLAAVYNRLGANATYQRMQSWRAYLLIPLTFIVLSGLIFRLSEPLYYTLGQSIGNFGGILLLDYAVRAPHSLLGKILNTRPLAAIGVLSYSIYLWQEMFVGELSIRYPINLILIAAASVASYYGIEKPFLKMRKWFRSRKESQVQMARSPGAMAPQRSEP